STTLLTNAVVQGDLAPVGLVVMPGPGVAPADLPFADRMTVVGGAMDHRGVEVAPPDAAELPGIAADFASRGIAQLAVVGKFSSR
ncbi:hypothetical protein J8J27_31255, partial [Mycobacterium tuberculosis]|nr:hypothetical protein [Mycobacterium tuberculosis]